MRYVKSSDWDQMLAGVINVLLTERSVRGLSDKKPLETSSK